MVVRPRPPRLDSSSSSGSDQTIEIFLFPGRLPAVLVLVLWAELVALSAFNNQTEEVLLPVDPFPAHYLFGVLLRPLR